MVWTIQPSEGDALAQLSHDSDRSVGIVAAALVERRLEEALKSRLRPDNDLLAKLFRPSGPIGTFSVKIDVAYLTGLVSRDGRSDLVWLKEIRNEFAHNIDAINFQYQRIADLCKNLTSVERFMFDSSDLSGMKMERFLGIADFDSLKGVPRHRTYSPVKP